ncbi:MAG: mycofactocin-coupled SDR family oxidoreductase [Actinobacteria bacterium]|nr:mycofactocin-coupled SDR family oxidoreductase [Actinomycetota bacterium]
MEAAMGRVDGKVAVITGAARGQGRSHAIRLAQEGASIIALDACRQFEAAQYPGATLADLEETVRLVREAGGQVVSAQVDVRDRADLVDAIDMGVNHFGRLDIVCANAGITHLVPALEVTESEWKEVLDINLTGVWNTAVAAIPRIIAGERGGSIILTSSLAGLRAFANLGSYTASKWGVVGIMKSLAIEFAPHNIRVNAINPTNVDTQMIHSDSIRDFFLAGQDDQSDDAFKAASQSMHLLQQPWISPRDVSDAVLFLASDESRFITGVALPIDLGALTR